MQQKQKVGRKPTQNYFEEKRLSNMVKEYQQTKDPNLYIELNENFRKLAYGMLNKQFGSNSYIRTMVRDKNGHISYTVEEALSDCVYEIFKTLKNYDSDKGRLFAYCNRISKNTLKRLSDKEKKRRTNELIYSQIYNNDENKDFDSTNEECVDNITVLNNNSEVKDKIDLDNGKLFPEPKNVVINYKTCMYIIYRYILYIYDTVKYFINNKEELNNIIENMKYDYAVDFEFPKNVLMNDIFFYNNLLSNLEKVLNNIKTWLEENYTEQINTEPESYDGKLSNRSLGYVRKFVKTKMKNNVLLNEYDINNLVKFIEYLIVRRGC